MMNNDWFMDYASHRVRLIALEQEWLEIRYWHLFDEQERRGWITKNGRHILIGEDSGSGGKSGKMVDNSGESGIIKSSIEDKFKDYVPDREHRKEIIARGIAAEKPVFDNGSLAKYYQYVEKEDDYYDVVMHGNSEAVSFFGTLIDYQTLGAIIMGRSDYKKGTPIRLFSCSTGKGEHPFAEYLSKQLNVEVKAPNQDIHINLPINGKSEYHIQSGKHKRDGEWVHFGRKEKK